MSDNNRNLPSTTVSGLDKPTLDDIGLELRAEARRAEPKPAYLGDRALPPEFERQLAEIERSVEIREKGVEAVGEALLNPQPASDDPVTEIPSGDGSALSTDEAAKRS